MTNDRSHYMADKGGTATKELWSMAVRGVGVMRGGECIRGGSRRKYCYVWPTFGLPFPIKS